MAQQSIDICDHERRPGTTVCLRCRHASRKAARARFQRLMLRGSAVAIVVVTFIAAGAVGATAIRSKAEGRQSAPTTTPKVAPLPAPQAAVVVDSAPRDTVPTAPATQVAGPPVAAPTPKAVERMAPPLLPIVPSGQSSLASGVTATRADTAVVVAFDTPETRTRRPDKFEQFVRATLPLIYGAGVREVLAKIPDGTIMAQGELLTELPARGIRIPLDGAWTIRLYPETRPGQDGPLVVRYRVSIVPTTE